MEANKVSRSLLIILGLCFIPTIIASAQSTRLIYEWAVG